MSWYLLILVLLLTPDQMAEKVDKEMQRTKDFYAHKSGGVSGYGQVHSRIN